VAERHEHQPIGRSRADERRELTQFNRRLVVLMSALAGLTLVGMVGFAALEGTSLAYGFSWTLDTITTLGTVPDPQDFGGRALKAVILVFGVGTLFYGLATVAEFFVSGQLSGLLSRRGMQNRIDSLNDHFIICGFGRVGRQVARDLRSERAAYVVVDENPDNREPAADVGVKFIDASPSDDEVLLQAGIERAKGVIACVDSDAENIFITLTARELRADIFIIARASAEDSEKKLLRAGADRVISPYKTSGTEMARVALHPQVGGAVAVADYRMEEIEVTPACEGAGKTIADIRGQSTIVALRHPDGRLEPQPAPHSVISAGDKLVALGTPTALEHLERVFQPASTPAA
jgi:voltage-gated potassium channel